MLKAGDEPIPGYQLEGFLGKGQFGEVWQCTTPGRARAALKFLDLSGKHGWKEFRAIQRVKAIRHPHLMPITALWLLDEHWNVIDDAAMDTAEARATSKLAETLQPNDSFPSATEPRWLVVAQLLGDQTLGDVLKQHLDNGDTGIPVSLLLRYMEEAAKGIDFLNSSSHDLGGGRVAVQHCDIKPANILMVGDSILICDFGVLQVLAPDVSTTATGMVGSPAYMAPECIERKPSHATDQYSLAVTYVELRTGKLPFDTESYFDVIDAHRQGTLNLSSLSPAERSVIRKATSVDPKNRYSSSGEMVRDLRRAVEGHTTIRASKRRQIVMLSLTILAMVTTIGFFTATVLRPPVSNGAGNASQPRVYTMRVSPVDAIVTVDGEAQSTDARGQVEFERSGKATVRISVSKAPEYQAEERQIDLSDYQQTPIEVQLKFSSDHLVRRGNTRWLSGDPEGGLNDYTTAIEQDKSIAQYPPPIYLLPAGASHPINRMRASVDDRWIVCGDQSGRVLAWDLESATDSFQARTLHQHDDPVESVAVGLEWIASADLAGQVRISRLTDRSTSPKSITLTENLIKLVISPDDRWLLAGSDDGSGDFVYVLGRWDLQSPTLSSSEPLGTHRGMIDDIVLFMEKGFVVTASWDRTVRAWPLLPSNRDTESRLIGGLTGDVYCLARVKDDLAFAGDGRLNTDSGRNATDPSHRGHRVVLATLDSTALLEFPEGHKEPIEVLESDTTGRWLASGSVDGMIQVWEIIDRQPRGPRVLVGGHSAKVNAMSFDATGEWLITGGESGEVVLWDVHNNSDPALIGRHDGAVTQIIVLPEGKSAISSGEDGTVRKWDLPKCQLIKRACGRLRIDAQPYIETGDSVDT